ncbi:MAG TPA: aminotransferase class IV, partial [Bryobacteraceae bacterium]|nr:aminotransferase class IV [Bryobacteraceae bacterium]
MGIHTHVLHNGRVEKASSAALRPGQIGVLAGWGVFSTLRVRHGALFAWNRHWARMTRDARLLNLAMPGDPAEVERDLLRLVAANQQTGCTLRLAILRNSGGMWEDPQSVAHPVDVVAMTATSKQWGASVKLGIQPDARHAACEFATAKVLSWAQNLSWAERALKAGNDEVVLLNEHGRVAECTSANIFAIFGNEVFTPPVSEGCLPGITREILLELSGAGISISEKPLTLDDLYSADGVFITSTTRNVLPVREIAGHAIAQPSAVPSALSQRLDDFTERDLASRPSA